MAPRDKALDSVTIEFPTNRKKQAQGEVQKGVDALHGPKLDMLHIETRDLKELNESLEFEDCHSRNTGLHTASTTLRNRTSIVQGQRC